MRIELECTRFILETVFVQKTRGNSCFSWRRYTCLTLNLIFYSRLELELELELFINLLLTKLFFSPEVSKKPRYLSCGSLIG